MTHRILISLLLYCSVCSVVRAQQPPSSLHPQAETAASRARHHQLLQCLKNGTRFDLGRATEELTVTVPVDTLVLRTFLTAMGPDKVKRGWIASRGVDFLAASGPTAIPEILRVFETSDRHLQVSVLLPALARMGSDARKAVPFLREAVKNPKTNRNLIPGLRITIAHIERDYTEIVKVLHEIEGNPDYADSMVLPLLCVRASVWPDKKFIDAAVQFFSDKQLIGQSGDAPHFAGVLVGLMGEKAAPVKDPLTDTQKRAIENRHPASVTITLALARIDPKHQETYLRDLFKNYLDRPCVFSRTMQSILAEVPYILMDSKLSTCLARLVEDPDPAVADGATCLLWWAGLAGRDAFPRLKQYVQGNASSERRALAANALGRVATFAQLRELEKLLASEKSGQVRQQLKSAVDYIRSLGTSSEDPFFLKNRYPPELPIPKK